MHRLAPSSLLALVLLTAAGCSGAATEGEGDVGDVSTALCREPVASLTSGCVPPRGGGGGTVTPPPPDAPATSAVYRATHNSFSGGDKGAILTQLRSGVRFLELDIQDNDYASVHD